MPIVKDANGLAHQWVPGEVGASCIDSHDHIITVNRGFQRNGLLPYEGSQSIPAPPVDGSCRRWLGSVLVVRGKIAATGTGRMHQ